MMKLFYFIEPNGSSDGCAIMRARFASLPVGEGEVQTKVNGTEQLVKLPENWKHVFTMLSWTRELVKDCQTKQEMADFFMIKGGINGICA
ncbi:MAG: hypothetical protein Q7R92_02460 [bacterium]|nr:hypothetical protein [bacterium]